MGDLVTPLKLPAGEVFDALALVSTAAPFPENQEKVIDAFCRLAAAIDLHQHRTGS